MTKQELRSIYLAKRRQLNHEEVQSLSSRLSHHLLTYFDFRTLGVLHTFLPIPANNEPDTRIIISKAASAYPGVLICVPKIKQGTAELEHFALTPDTPMAENKWGILEPVDGPRVEVQKIDMVLVPLLAFDRSGNRVGYGKGYYDRFLSQCRRDALRVGLSLFEVGPGISDVNADDVPLHYCVTPSGVQSFERHN
ncbi:MAG TPA: 5-formyltetrahydrofolate cyclo-ligase [Ohtaekwangia sp.]|nr:5-formyltetrahydrofolate cyclo-ligase [Ohtaekwangia sp.]